MGNSSSHQPLERGFTRGTYGDVKSSVCTSFIIISYYLRFQSWEQWSKSFSLGNIIFGKLKQSFVWSLIIFIKEIFWFCQIKNINLYMKISLKKSNLRQKLLSNFRKQPPSAPVNVHRRKWIVCGNLFETHLGAAKTKSPKLQSLTCGKRMSKRWEMPLVLFQSNTWDA